MATTAAVSLETYLETSYKPDVEYLDGILREKSVTGYPHGVVQGLLFEWFRSHRKEWSISCSIETRTLTSSQRVRLPDVVVIRAGEAPKSALVEAPLLAIEVLSPSDRYSDLKARAGDLQRMGTPDIWLIDPERRTAEAWGNNSWIETNDTILRSSVSPVMVDLNWLWTELDDSQ